MPEWVVPLVAALMGAAVGGLLRPSVGIAAGVASSASRSVTSSPAGTSRRWGGAPARSSMPIQRGVLRVRRSLTASRRRPARPRPGAAGPSPVTPAACAGRAPSPRGGAAGGRARQRALHGCAPVLRGALLRGLPAVGHRGPRGAGRTRPYAQDGTLRTRCAGAEARTDSTMGRSSAS